MAAPVISVRDLWKEYAVGHSGADHAATFYDLLSSSLMRPFRRGPAQHRATPPPTSFWALREIDFDVQPGDVVGVIGRNGAGKSTLLKILSRITAPTRGRIEVRGRLASLLEVGTGFHPELTGRENIFLNGSILGMGRREVARKLESIVEFAEIGAFIDTPVKRYSSGMYVRLAFSVAAHLDPDILVVDEVLAVGDADFQRKCIGQMETISREGRTLLVVSHNMQLVQKLCPRAILLDKGRMLAAGDLAEVQQRYLASGATDACAWSPIEADEQPFQYESVRVLPPAGHSASALPADRPFSIEFKYEVLQPVTSRIAVRVRNQFGTVVFTSSNTDAEAYINKTMRPGKYAECCTIPASMLAPGKYWVSISRPLASGDEVLEDIFSFEVDRSGSLADRDHRDGVIAPLLHWESGVME